MYILILFDIYCTQVLSVLKLLESTYHKIYYIGICPFFTNFNNVLIRMILNICLDHIFMILLCRHQ